MPRNILIALDGSKGSEAILPEVQRIATLRDSVHFFHAVPPVPAQVGLAPESLNFQDQASAYLEIVRERWFREQKGLNLVGFGDPAEGILGQALEKNIDLIAMTTHRRSGVARFLLGSVAATVVRKSQLPVLLTRPDVLCSSRDLRRILVAVEGSETPKDLLETVKSLSSGTNAEIVLFHAVPRVKDPSPQWAERTPISLQSRPDHYLQKLADALEKSGFTAWPKVTTGEAVVEILKESQVLDVDIIALPTRGRSGLERLVAGSVAEGVLRKSPVAVLLQKPLVVHQPAHL